MVKASRVNATLPGITTTALLTYPNDEDTADCGLFCTCDDGSDYAVKGMEADARIPHSEWFCTRLGERVGLLSPPASIVVVDGEECFGSRWETDPQRDWWIQATAGTIAFADLAGGLSRILAFDLFVHNDDRHLKNYLVRRQKTKHTVLAFDYSRAWLCNGIPPPAVPMGPDTGTIQTFRYLTAKFGEFLSPPDVAHVLNGLRKVPSSVVEQIILQHPQKWLTEEEKTAIIKWWNSAERLERLDQIEGGMGDGSIL
jgi:hypothetical protein